MVLSITQISSKMQQLRTSRNFAQRLEYHFKTVAINSCWTTLAHKELEGSGVGITTCIGFPLGACSTAAKVAEAKQAVADKTTEIDMVINGGHLIAGDDDYVIADIKAVVEAAGIIPVKVILECCLLNDEQIVRACKDCLAAGAAFVKTSTGFSTGGNRPRRSTYARDRRQRVSGEGCRRYSYQRRGACNG